MNKEQIEAAQHYAFTYWNTLNTKECAETSFIAGAEYALSQSRGMRWSIIQAMIRCGLANNPTEAFRHQVVRLQQQFESDSEEFKSITEMLNTDPEYTSFRLVQSQSPSSSDRLKEENKEMLEMLKELQMYFPNGHKLNSLITKIESNGK